MASKFQNRLVGTIILVALGVIVLPGLLDGQKKYYQDEFAAIPLVPKPGDNDEPDMLPQVNQALPAQPPEGAGAEVQAGSSTPSGLRDAAMQPELAIANNDVPVPRERPKPVEKPQPKPVENKTETRVAEPVAKPEPVVEKPPTGQAFVVQVGALKNADKVNEIVAKLRQAGFKAYTLPSTPVQNSVTRIMVGPDASKEKLNSSLNELKSLSGLPGAYVMRYTP
ncbi:cell division protein DedD [Klebsiella sp. BIGb0407]|uniref:cell division protein DedD n=1 Tax=Klebsiella sp. BIGb0407 TaxID=2940603 RepID=UPI0021680EFD|nr:cell division protein DedD [Klebsiella sp. BIGb0407]MCS3431697.1 DedD protein [Klebsiella sp. BIGb0407]